MISVPCSRAIGLAVLAFVVAAPCTEARGQIAAAQPAAEVGPSTARASTEQMWSGPTPTDISERALEGPPGELASFSFFRVPLVAASDQVPLPPPRHGRFKFLQQVGSDFKHLPSKDSVYWLAGGGALALAVHPQDDETNRRLIPHHTFFNPGQTVGSVYVQGGSALMTYVVGRATGKEKVKHLGTDMLSAQIVAQALTQALKFSVRRERPDGSNNHSFPSGHASATFATATVLQRHLGWRAAVPTYTLATYVAMSRLQENRHFVSDVVFGAALGVVAGRTTTRHGRAHWAFIPDVSKGKAGLVLSRIP
jgi:membrane-associated phospholipid phosphatase